MELTVEQIRLEFGMVREAIEKHGSATPWERIYSDHVRFLLAELDKRTPSPSACKASPSGCKSESADKLIAAAIALKERHEVITGPTDVCICETCLTVRKYQKESE